jgi:CheY-like chemotaxis protein
VHDTGIGFTPEVAAHMFERFRQGDSGSTREFGGLGVGLGIVRHLVELHGGTVEARSEGVGKGSIFVVRLPALDSAPAKGKRPSPVEGPARSAASGTRRILVVDDNADARDLLTEILQRAGHEVRAADSGPGALALLEEFVPDIAILDVGLPAMDGYELGARLRADLGPRAPALVALTGYGQEGDRVRSKSAGFCAHLVKPLEASELLATIDACAARAPNDG